MNVTKMRTLLRKRGPLAFPLVAGYFALHYAKRHKVQTAAVLALGAGGIALLSHFVAQPPSAISYAQCKCQISAVPDAAKDPLYDVTDLGTLGGNFSQASALNNRGQVAGTSIKANGDAHGYLWQNGKMTDMGTLGGEFSVTTALNNNGAAAGLSADKDMDYVHAFAWRDGKMSRVFPKSEQSSVATGINDSGAIVGISQDEQERVWGFSRKGDKLNLFRYGGSDFTIASAINAGGIVAGFSIADCKIKSFTLNEGKFRPLPGLKGEDCFAEAINERGDVAGASFLKDSDNLHAVVWRDGKPVDLGALPGLPDSFASAVNRRGIVVGAALPPDENSHSATTPAILQEFRQRRLSHIQDYRNPAYTYQFERGDKLSDLLKEHIHSQDFDLTEAAAKNEIPHAFVWEDGKMRDLNTLLPSGSGWIVAIATGINDNGDISGVGLHNGKVRAFLLSYRR